MTKNKTVKNPLLSQIQAAITAALTTEDHTSGHCDITDVLRREILEVLLSEFRILLAVKMLMQTR